MSVTIGTVETFPDAEATCDQVVKMSEEVMETFSALEDYLAELELDKGLSRNYERITTQSTQLAYDHVLDECADVIQATANLLAALGCKDFRKRMDACRRRQVARGRM